MSTLIELESLKQKIDKQQKEIDELKEILYKMQEDINSKNNNNILKKKEDNNDLSIIFTRYKNSVLLKNKYKDKNGSFKCKTELKELGAKWIKKESIEGWLFIGIYKNDKNTIEEICQFIVKKLTESNFNLEIDYE